jgi:hypothetical protein
MTDMLPVYSAADENGGMNQPLYKQRILISYSRNTARLFSHVGV